MKSTYFLRRLLAGSSLAFVCVSFASAADGVFTWADLGGGDNDANVGLSSSKTYVNAVNTQGGALTINGVNFEASSGANPSGTDYSIAGVPSTYSGGINNITGQLGSLVDGFIYGGNPTSTFNLTGLTTGQTYSLAFYNRGWDKDYNRTQNITTTGGAATTFTSDFNNPGDLNILRYTFTATGGSETVNFNSAAGNTFHFYGFATEQTFNNTWTSGADWSTASWSLAQPNDVGSNADFTAQGSPTSINLDANRTVGHIRFDGANAWTVSGANTLTLQADVGGLSVLGASSGSHTISTAVNLSNTLLKTGAGTVELSGAINAGSHNITLGAGTLALSGDTTNIGNSGTIGFGGGNLKVAANTSTSRSLNFSNAGGIDVASGSTLTLTGGQWTGNGGFTKTGVGAMVVGSNFPGNDRFEVDSTRGGVFNMNAGSFTISSGTTYFVMGDDGQNATFNQSGGTFTNDAGGGVYLANGGGASTMNISGGTFSSNGGPMRLGQGGGATGTLNIGGGAGLASVTLPSIISSEVASNATAVINLNSNGLLNVSKISKHTGAISVTFNGGTLQASTNESTFMQGLDSATINSGGATIDSQAFAITIGQAMGGTGGLTKTGSGSLTLTGNSSYTGATQVSAGTLLVSGQLGSSEVPTGLITVGADGTFGGNGAIFGDLNFDADSNLLVVNLGDTLAVTGTVTFGSGFGIANLFGIDWNALDLNTAYTVLSTTQTFSTSSIGNFGFDNRVAVGAGREAYFTNGSLQVVVIPEPSAALLGSLGVLCLLRRRR